MHWYLWLLVSTLGIKVKTIFEMYHDDVIFILLKFKDIAMKTWRKWFKHSVEHWKTLCKKKKLVLTKSIIWQEKDISFFVIQISYKVTYLKAITKCVNVVYGNVWRTKAHRELMEIFER